jgi:2-dehydro-3-deoxygalactonokinase
MMNCDLICVDWGTSSFRAHALSGGRIVARTSAPRGILTVAPGEHAAVLASLLADMPSQARALPIVMSGMIGSRQGWVEAPYVPAPASLGNLAAWLVTWQEPGLGPISLVPGVMQDPQGGIPDVMRGEETQVFGALALMGLHEGIFIMPGTHSKCIVVEAAHIVRFASFMTGEVFAALKGHTILGRLMTDDAGGVAAGPGEGFARGVLAARGLTGAGALLNAVFGARTLGLFERLPGGELADYLSGVLIGAELCAALPERGGGIVVGNGELVRRYTEAARLLGRTLTPAPEDSVVAGQAAILSAAGIS